MSTRITLAANVAHATPVHVIVPDDRAVAYVEALHMLDATRRAAGTTPVVIESVAPEPTPTVALLVEVEVATARPPRTDARTWTWVSVEAGPHAGAHAEAIACEMAMCHPAVVMPVRARVIDWVEG